MESAEPAAARAGAAARGLGQGAEAVDASAAGRATACQRQDRLHGPPDPGGAAVATDDAAAARRARTERSGAPAGHVGAASRWLAGAAGAADRLVGAACAIPRPGGATGGLGAPYR